MSGNHPKERIQLSEYGEILKSRMLTDVYIIFLLCSIHCYNLASGFFLGHMHALYLIQAKEFYPVSAVF